MVLPWPFTKSVYCYGEPIVVPRDGDVEEWRQKVEKAMHDIAEEAERLVNQR